MQGDDVIGYRRFGTITFPIYMLLGKCIKSKVNKSDSSWFTNITPYFNHYDPLNGKSPIENLYPRFFNGIKL